jgi:RTX calcium-binding nonapeptide repeat (4 copies)/Domain of unknown function DUF11
MPTLPNLIYNITGSKVFYTSILTGEIFTPTNPLTGATIPNNLSFTSQAVARDHLSSDQLLYYTSNNNQADNQVHLGTWNPVTGAAADLGALSISGLTTSIRMAFRDNGQLYLMKGGALYTVSTGTNSGTGNSTPAATTTLVTNFSLSGSGGDMAFDPANPNNLYIASGSNLYRVTFTGAVPSLPVLVGIMPAGATGLAFGADGNLYGGDGTTLRRISTGNASTVTIGTLAGVSDFATLATVTPDADLSVTVTDAQVNVAQNGTVTYTITVTNNSAIDLTGVDISDNFTNPNLSGTPSWSAPNAAGVTFPSGSQSGTGNLNVRVNLAAGATVTYTVTGLTATGAQGSFISNTATVKPPEGFTDKASNAGANSATDSTTIANPSTPGVSLTPASNLVTTEQGGTGTFNAVLISQPTADVTLTFTSNNPAEGTVTSTITFTSTNWNIPQVVTVTGVDDQVKDGNVPYSINTSVSSSDTNYNNLAVPAVSVTNIDNEVASVVFSPSSGLTTTELGGTATFTAILTSQPTSDVTFTFTSSDPTEGTVTSTLTFTAANWNVPQTVTITGVDDSIVDVNTPYTIATTITSADPNYNNIAAPAVNVTNVDNEFAGVTFTPNSGLNTTESGGTATFTAKLDSQPTADVTLTFTSSDPTEGTITTTLIFTPANWNIPQTATIVGVDDAGVDGNIPYTIFAIATSNDPAYNTTDLSSIAVTNIDNETPGVSLTPTNSLTTTEAGGTATFTAVLSSQPTSDVTFTFTSSDPTEGTVTTSITFTSANWNTPQVVTITGIDDGDLDGSVPYTISTLVSSDDRNYDNITVPIVSVTNQDNETPIQPPVIPNQAPVTADVSVTIQPGQSSPLRNLSATDSDGIAFYTITSLPDSQQGLLYLGDPANGGTPIVRGQVIPANLIGTLFFRATDGLSKTGFSYTATDSSGVTDLTPAQVMFSAAAVDCGCKKGSSLAGTRSRNRLQGTAQSDRIQGLRGNDVLHGWDCDDTIEGGRGKDKLFGDNGRDILFGGGGKDRLKGGADQDRLFGGRGKDRLKGGSGNDFLKGGQRRDRLNGGTGQDRLWGGRGNDLLQGKSGADRLRGNLGRDRLRGGKGRDWLAGGMRRDRLSGGRGKDILLGGRGDDSLNGNENNDLLRGGLGSDRLSGDRGNDRLKGGLRRDYLDGGAGNDVLVGGRAADVLTCGGGSDRLVYRGFYDGGDRVVDFDVRMDAIDLGGLGVRNAKGFRNLVKLEQRGANTVVRVDSIRQPDFMITLENVNAIDLGMKNFGF